MPQFEFYVLYNGQRAAVEFEEMLLSNTTENNSDNLELKVKFYNITKPNNSEFKKKSLPLEGYCVIIEKYVKNKKFIMNDK